MRTASTRRARSGRSSPSRPCSCARTAPCRTCGRRFEDGQPIQILTTRDKDDPDALYVLRHSAAHLLAEAVRRLYPGVKIAIGPPIENGFYYDFEFPEPIREEDLARIEEEVNRELAEGREWTRTEITADEARERFAAEGEPYKVELVDTAEGPITLYTQGDFTDLCRGPHLQNSGPIKAIKLLSLAGAYWRGDEHNPQLTRVYGTAFYSQADLDAYLERIEEAKKRDHRRLGTQLDLFHLSDDSPGSPFWHPKGMVLWNALEDLRRRENLKRGYSEVKTPLLYDVEVYKTSGHYENYAENMFFVPDGERTFALKPMNCPGHMLLFGSRMRSYRELPIRYAESSTLHRNELAGTLHGLLRVRHITQDDAHIFCTEEQIQPEIDAMIEFVRDLYALFEVTPHAELSTRPEKRLGTDEQWDTAEGALRGRARAARAPVRDRRGRRHLLRAEDRPAHGRRARPQLADGDDPARLPDADAVRAHLRRGRQHRAPSRGDPPRAARLAGALPRDPDRALRRRLPVLARARPGARRPRQRPAIATPRPRSPIGFATPGTASSWTTGTTPSASGSATRSSTRCPTRSSTASANRTSRWRSGSGAASRRRRAFGISSPSLLRCEPAKQGRTRFLTSGATLREVQPSRQTRIRAAACSGFVVRRED